MPINALASEMAKGMGPPGATAAYRRTWRGRRCWVSVTFDKGGAVVGYAQGQLLSPLEAYLQ